MPTGKAFTTLSISHDARDVVNRIGRKMSSDLDANVNQSNTVLMLAYMYENRSTLAEAAIAVGLKENIK